MQRLARSRITGRLLTYNGACRSNACRRNIGRRRTRLSDLPDVGVGRVGRVVVQPGAGHAQKQIRQQPQQEPGALCRVAAGPKCGRMSEHDEGSARGFTLLSSVVAQCSDFYYGRGAAIRQALGRPAIFPAAGSWARNERRERNRRQSGAASCCAAYWSAFAKLLLHCSNPCAIFLDVKKATCFGIRRVIWPHALHIAYFGLSQFVNHAVGDTRHQKSVLVFLIINILSTGSPTK